MPAVLAKPDWWIIQEIARCGMGCDWNYAGPRDVFNEMRKAMNSIAGTHVGAPGS